MKISSNQYDRVTPSQGGSKERDEGYVSAPLERSKGRNAVAADKAANTHAHTSTNVSEDHSQRLIEQRKRDQAEQLSERDKAREQIQQNEELSAQRKLESRAAANREKIKDSYDMVKQSDNQARAEKMVADEKNNNRPENNIDPINLVV